jgi:phosphoribosyl-AMP cyclohydrolase / phosphoribosyl-ATP pyrophosphohydrolase
MNIEQLTFDAHGLIPAIIQDVHSGEVLMMAYMNKESVEKTLATGKTWFFSRSRQKLWLKGETSGHYQHIKEAFYDCDADTLLFKVEQVGVACHEGYASCFHYALTDGRPVDEQLVDPECIYGTNPTVLSELFRVIADRKVNPQEGSYTTYLFTKGQDKILKKVGEEAAETIIASKNHSKDELVYEMADLWYHCLVLLADHGYEPKDIFAELAKRRK